MPGRICKECGRGAPEDALRCPECGAMLGVDAKDRLAMLAGQVGLALGEHYRVEELVGKGGAAIVFRVHDERLNRNLAAKVLNPDLLASVELAQRFRREAQTAAALLHPNIVPIFFVGGDEHIPCYVMPLIEGESLGNRIRREGQLPVDVAFGIAKDIASALDFAHAAGVIHRDVKPDNILLDFTTGRSVLMDFGIAKAFQESDAELTGSGVVIGTPQYVSPEQAVGEKDIDGRTDVYSLGCVVFEMLAGRPPFTGRTAQAIFAQHISAEFPSLESSRPGLPRSVGDVLTKAVDKDAKKRFDEAGEFVRALERAHGRRSLRTSGSTVVQRHSAQDMDLLRKLTVTADEPSLTALLTSDEVTSVTEAAGNVERFLGAAAGKGDWVSVSEGIAALRKRANDPRPPFRHAAERVLERVGDEAAVVEALAAGWQAADDQGKAQVEEALSATAGLSSHLLDLAVRERSPVLMLLADRVGGLTHEKVEVLSRDSRIGVIESFITALNESLRPTQTIERWLTLVLQHPKPEARKLAVQAAGLRRGTLAERIGRLALGDAASDVRRVGLLAMGRSHRREALQDLARSLEHGTKQEQLAAAEALGELGVAGAASILSRVFERKRFLWKERGPLQETAATALARLPQDVSGHTLRALAQDRNPRIASIATTAIEGSEDPLESVPDAS